MAELGPAGVQQAEPVADHPAEDLLMRLDDALGELGQAGEADQAFAGQAAAGRMLVIDVV